MDEQTRVAAMKAFQIALMLGGSAAVSFGHADQGAVTTWTDSAMHAAPQFVGAVWLLANHYGFKLSDLFRKDTSRVDALEQAVAALRESLTHSCDELRRENAVQREQVLAWMREVEARKSLADPFVITP